MKKIANLILGAAAAIAMTGCSSAEEVKAPGTGGDITVTVTADAVVGDSRASVETVPGYELKCVMQLFADDGVAVGARSEMDASTGSAAFVIHEQDIDNGATKAVFWAEYVPIDPLKDKKVYNSEDLSDIKYEVTAFDVTNKALMAAADAFTGVITTLENGATATLTRPMIRLNFSPKNPEAGRGSRKIVVSYEAPSGYNAVTGTCNLSAYQALSYTDEGFNPDQNSVWFSNLIIAPTNLSKLDKEISMAISGRVYQQMTIPANTIPLDPNFIVNASAEITEKETQDLEVEVTVDTEFTNDPNKPVEMTVGSYINAQGKATADISSAVGIVFYMGPISGDKIGLYPEQYKDKTIKAYAVAIENVKKARAQLNEAFITDLAPNEALVNGTQNSENVLSKLGASAFNTAWTEWTAAHPLQSVGENTTDWYLPSRNQMEEWMSMILPTHNLKGELIGGTPSGSLEFRALFPLNTIFDRDPFQNCMYATCSVNSNGNIQGCSLTASGTTGSVKFSQIDIQKKTQSVLGRPMITIFE